MTDNIELLVVFVLLGIFSVAGAIGNAFVLYIYSRKRDKTTSSLFILTLAGTDFFTCILIIPFNIVVLHLNYKLEYELPCKLYMFLITCNVPFSAFVMVAIAFDRYFCICRPFLHAITIPRAKIIVVITGIFACILGIFTALCHGIQPDIINKTFENSTEDRFRNMTGIQTVDSYLTSATTQRHPNYSIIYEGTTVSIDNATGTSKYVEAVPGMCVTTTNLFDMSFISIYQKIYSGFYLVSFLVVLVLYGLIYRAIHVRRALKAKRKRSSLFPAAPHEYSAVDTQMTVLNNGHEINGKDEHGQKKFRKKSLGLKEKVFYANIRTAAMLFIVTVVFLIAFLPSWLMAYGLVSYNMIIFYMYFIYNVANPIIYAFMNTSFRDDLQILFKKICNRK